MSFDAIELFGWQVAHARVSHDAKLRNVDASGKPVASDEITIRCPDFPFFGVLIKFEFLDM